MSLTSRHDPEHIKREAELPGGILASNGKQKYPFLVKLLLTLKPKDGHMVAVLLANSRKSSNLKSLGAS